MKMKFRYLMAPEDDFGGGGGEEDVDLQNLEGEDSSSDGGSTESGEGGNAPQFDINTLSTAMAQAIRSTLPQAQPQQQPQLTQEQIDKQMKKFAANEELASKLFNVDATPAERAQILNQIINGVTEHALTVAGYMQKYSADQLKGELVPIQAHIEELKLKDFTRSVTLEYPGLKGRDQLIHAAISQINNMGINPKSKKEAVKMVGQAVANYAKQIDPNFQLVPQQQQQRQGGTARLMMGNSGGGARGSGQGGGKQQKPAWQSLFGS